MFYIKSRLFTVFHPASAIRYNPRAVSGATKYGVNGLYAEDSFPDVPENLRKTLAASANFAITKNTHSTYGTASRMWEMCILETGMSGNFPASEQDVLCFSAWLITRGLAGSSIEAYLSGIRTAHLSRGIKPPTIKSDLIKTVLAGRHNIDQLDKRIGLRRSRMPIVPSMLRVLKEELRTSGLDKVDKLAMWASALILFFGALRPGELMCANVGTFDPDFTLLRQDISLKDIMLKGEKLDTLQLFIKSDKTDKEGKGRLLDIYSSDSDLCPVKAYVKYLNKSNHTDPEKPAIRLASGKPLTTKQFNVHLKSFLGKHVDTESGVVSGHSFRAGIASLAGLLGYSESQIKSIGRWSSDAYMVYLKLPRTRRQEMSQEMRNQM